MAQKHCLFLSFLSSRTIPYGGRRVVVQGCSTGGQVLMHINFPRKEYISFILLLLLLLWEDEKLFLKRRQMRETGLEDPAPPYNIPRDFSIGLIRYNDVKHPWKREDEDSGLQRLCVKENKGNFCFLSKIKREQRKPISFCPFLSFCFSPFFPPKRKLSPPPLFSSPFSVFAAAN